MVYDCVLICILFLSTYSVGCISDLSKNRIIQHELIPDYLFSKFKNRTVETNLRDIFEQINIIRTVGSPGHLKVRQFITRYLEEHGWKIELDTFEEDTIIGQKIFHNIIGYKDPLKYSKFLILACHYDSKMITNFVGSTDSAMPCSIILKIIDLINDGINSLQNFNIGLKVVFFDGEEAFQEWTDTDSLYGSRHLASKWDKKSLPSGQTELSKIDLLVLLDLLGAKHPQIPNYHYEKRGNYNLLTLLEMKMRSTNLLKSTGPKNNFYFEGEFNHKISDDHIPFTKKGVPALHLIPIPFPKVWHTTGDNASVIHWDTCVDLLFLVEAFVRSYLHILL
ncbi:unnamed protein product [Heterobilharzia americana]|nr:unnamed protein product [Heterobilharzia americana]